MTLQFYSCFISYAHGDNAFAQRLHDDLESKGVSCWKDSENMAAGRFWRVQISQAIKNYDKLILICSQKSLDRPAVVDEVLAAIERERESHSQKLFPLRLDNTIISEEMLALADEKMEAGEWREDWVRYVRAYHIPDFSKWQEEDAYRTGMERLLRDLQHPSAR